MGYDGNDLFEWSVEDFEDFTWELLMESLKKYSLKDGCLKKTGKRMCGNE